MKIDLAFSGIGFRSSEVNKSLPLDKWAPHPNLENIRAFTFQAPKDTVWCR